MPTLGQAIKNARQDAQMSQSELAAKIGVTQPRMSALERGASKPDLDLIASLEKALKLKRGHLLKASGHAAPDEGGVNVEEVTVHLQAAVEQLAQVAKALGYEIVPARDRAGSTNKARR